MNGKRKKQVNTGIDGEPEELQMNNGENEVVKEPLSDNISERRKEILKIIVKEYVKSYIPVSSEVVANKFSVPVSPATIRNEMVELEREEFITHPHTSAGRIPSDKGYRYYVEHLMERPSSLTLQEQHTIQHQFHQIQLELNEWLRLAASITARTAQNVAVVTSPHVFDCRLKRLELIGVQDKLVLLVLVTQDGTIKEQIISLEEPINQEDLSGCSARINAQLYDLNRNQVEKKIIDWIDNFDSYVANRVVEALRNLEQYHNSQIYREGLGNILNQPDFSDITRLRQVMNTIESGLALPAIIPEVLNSEESGVQVIIGGENRFDDLRLLSVVLGRYGIGGQVVGVVGVVGPTRMAYNRSISTVQYITQLMTKLLSERSGTGSW